MARRSELGFRRRSEPGGGPWAGGSVSWRKAASGLFVAARSTVARMAGAGGARRRAAPRQLLEAARIIARRMAAANAARRRAVSVSSRRMEAARSVARRMEGAGGARRRTASRQLEPTRATLILE
jgi:hypothetical protein